MKYFVYVSKSKVEMLFPQIPKTTVKKVEKKIEVNLKLLNISFAEKNFDETLYSKLNAVVEYLNDSGSVGTISKPNEYFYGKIFLQWTEIYPKVVFYGGMLNDIALGLGGSMKHVLGFESAGVEKGISHTPWLVELLSNEVEKIVAPSETKAVKLNPEEIENRIAQSTQYWAQELSERAFHKFEFLAKTLKVSSYRGHKILIGTPLYVASE
jgi:hypothetical protein